MNGLMVAASDSENWSNAIVAVAAFAFLAFIIWLD